jgi:hypothetical protein
MSLLTPVERAKADIAEYNKKISALETEIIRLQAQKNRLMSERSRIQAFVEMFDRYTAPPPAAAEKTAAEAPTTNSPVAKSTIPSPEASRGAMDMLFKPMTVKVSAKPESAPTIPAMIKEALEVAAKASGADGLRPKEMAEFIAKMYWPQVQSDRINPVAWRMWKAGELVKDGELYKLPPAP